MQIQGAVFIVISRKDKVTGLMKKTHHMAYVSPQAEDVVLSREAMESIELVSNLDDRKEASVRHLSTTPANGGSNSSVPVVDEEAPRHGGLSLHISQRFESTPAVERHRSAAPDGRSGRATPPAGSSAGGGSTQGHSSWRPAYIGFNFRAQQ